MRDNATASIRQVARHTGLSKRRVHRLGPARARRHQHPASWLWATADGHRWCIRLLVAVLSVFGLKRGGGAETMRAFGASLRLEQQVGCAPSPWRAVLEKLARRILATTEAWEREGLAQGQSGPMVGSVDATFVARMRLGCMDLVSGDVLREAVADNRTSETCYARVTVRLEPMHTDVLSLVSARAKALSKLAARGLECPSIPEVLPLLQALALGSQWKTARQALSRAPEHGATCQAAGASAAQIAWAPAAGAAGEADVAPWQQVRDTYRGHLGAMAVQGHPWRVTDSTPQSAQEVAAPGAAEVAALPERLERHGLTVQKQGLDNIRQQLGGLAAVSDVWGQTVRQDVHQQMTLTPLGMTWVEGPWLPLMYWQ